MVIKHDDRCRTLTQAWREVPEIRAAFFGALVFGLISQGMALFNKFSWHDDIFSIFLTGETITSGRWMLHVLTDLEILIFGDGHFSLPLMNGLFSLLCIGISAGLIVNLLKIRNQFFCVMLGAVMAAFPAVTALFSFMFAVPYYMLALLMVTAGAFLICGAERWYGKAMGVILAGCSVGVYQAFLPVLLTIILLYDIMFLTEGKDRLADAIKKILIHGLSVLAAMAFYVAVSQFFLAITEQKLSPYMGINQAGSLPLQTYLQRAGRAYREFFQPSRNVRWDMYPQHLHYMYYLMLAADAVLGMILIVRTWKKNQGKALLTALLLALYPLGCNFIFVMSAEVHSLMVYGQIMHAALFVWFADRVKFRLPTVRRAFSLAAAMMLSVTCIMYARYDNQCYLKAEFQQQEAISWYTTLATQIKSTPGYRDELPVAWVNENESRDLSLYNIDELDFLMISGYEANIQDYVNSWAWKEFAARWCGFRPETVSSEEVERLPEVQAMPHYPDDGSIRVVQDMVVVKF